MSFGACAMDMRAAPMVNTMTLKTAPAAKLAPVSSHSKHELIGKHAVSAIHNSSNKRIKKRRRRAFAVDDARRSYVDQIFGAINSGDGILSTLERIAHPDVMMSCRFLGDPSTITTGKLYREVKGRELIAKFVDAMLMASPDAVLKLHEKKMRLRQNNSSYIVAKYTLEGYKFCNLLTTNDKTVTKKIMMPSVKPSARPTVASMSPATSKDDSSTDMAVYPTLFNTRTSSSSNSLGDDSEDDSDEEDEMEEWNDEHFFDDMGDDFDLPAATCVPSVDKSIQERSELLLQASQFLNRHPNTISGYDQKVSIATQGSEFGLSQSLSMPVLVSTIGTMALHINPSRQVYKIDFLWTYNQNSKTKSSMIADEIKVIHN